MSERLLAKRYKLKTHRASFVKEQEEEAIKTITKNNDKLSSLMKKS